MCEHNEQECAGHRGKSPDQFDAGRLFAQIKLTLNPGELENLPVHFGGPVQTDRGFVLHEPAGEWQSLMIKDRVGMTTSKIFWKRRGWAKGRVNCWSRWVMQAGRKASLSTSWHRTPG
jgi:putative transcriptional regulator